MHICVLILYTALSVYNMHLKKEILMLHHILALIYSRLYYLTNPYVVFVDLGEEIDN